LRTHTDVVWLARSCTRRRDSSSLLCPASAKKLPPLLHRRGPHGGRHRRRRATDVGQWAAGAAGAGGRAAERSSEDGDAAGAAPRALQTRAVSCFAGRLPTLSCHVSCGFAIAAPRALQACAASVSERVSSVFWRVNFDFVCCIVRLSHPSFTPTTCLQRRERQNCGRQLRNIRHVCHHRRRPRVRLWTEQLWPAGAAG